MESHTFQMEPDSLADKLAGVFECCGSRNTPRQIRNSCAVARRSLFEEHDVFIHLMPACFRINAGLSFRLGTSAVRVRNNQALCFQNLINQKQVRQQRPQVNRSVQTIDELRAEGRLGKD
jgi:hypothetical protein